MGRKRFHPYFPEWLIVWDTRAVTDFYEGESFVPWALWVKPHFRLDSFHPATLCSDDLCLNCAAEAVGRTRTVYISTRYRSRRDGSTNLTARWSEQFFQESTHLGRLWKSLPFFHLLNGLHEYVPAPPTHSESV